MMKKEVKRDHSGFESDYDSLRVKKVVGSKDRSSKRKLSIYDEYGDEDEYLMNEKFKNRHK
ncbi:MAG: hypothetical protein L3J11_01235 [Draconibacterium sp.]|nr:hypothetical protein [Draconibacterium sp.]